METRTGCVYPVHGQAAAWRVETVMLLFSDLAKCGEAAQMTKGFGTHRGTAFVRHMVLPAGKMMGNTEGCVCVPPKGCEFRRGGANNTRQIPPTSPKP